MALAARFGSGAFGSLLRLLGVIALSPVADIPGASTVIAAFIVLIAGQLAIGRRQIWLPRRLGHHVLESVTLDRIVRFGRPPARLIGRLTRRRLAALAEGQAARAIGALILVLALMLLPLKVVPFGATVPSAAIAALGFALAARDGHFTLLALIPAAGALYLVTTLGSALGLL